jgi:fermentation-respiration switch protein FrsA (DUF1100 family)
MPLVTTTTAFDSHGTRCAAWLTLPRAPGPHPAIVLAHGFGANHTVSLAQYEQHFAGSGIATLAFDYRHTGESGGLPRQRLSTRRHREDISAALDFARSLPELDEMRIALWGNSLGAMHALKVAARRVDLGAVVVQCPIVDGLATARQLGVSAALRLGPAMLADAVRRLVGATPHYVPLSGQCGRGDRSGCTGRLERDRLTRRSTTGLALPTCSGSQSPVRCGQPPTSGHPCWCACRSARR